MSNSDGAIIRDLRGDYKFRWLEQIMKDYFKESLEELLTELKEREQEKTPLLTIDDIAKRFKVTKATIHNWINRKIIVGNKVGKNRYFTEDEVRDALKKYGFLKAVDE